jgi:hypothetical protein
LQESRATIATIVYWVFIGHLLGAHCAVLDPHKFQEKNS